MPSGEEVGWLREAFQTWGPSGLLVVSVALGLWRTVRVLGPRIGALLEAHLGFLRQTSETLKAQHETLENQSEELERARQEAERQREAAERAAAACEANARSAETLLGELRLEREQRNALEAEHRRRELELLTDALASGRQPPPPPPG